MNTANGSLETRDPRNGSPRTSSRIVMRVVLLLAFIASTVVLTQCQMVGDKLTGVQVGVFKRKNDCVRKCADTRKDADKAERHLHRSIEKACDGNAACLSEEKARHDAAEDAIDAAYRACVNDCHAQGGGDHGHDDN